MGTIVFHVSVSQGARKWVFQLLFGVKTNLKGAFHLNGLLEQGLSQNLARRERMKKMPNIFKPKNARISLELNSIKTVIEIEIRQANTMPKIQSSEPNSKAIQD